jgi:hypothetical protein
VVAAKKATFHAVFIRPSFRAGLPLIIMRESMAVLLTAALAVTVLSRRYYDGGRHGKPVPGLEDPFDIVVTRLRPSRGRLHRFHKLIGEHVLDTRGEHEAGKPPTPLQQFELEIEPILSRQ